MAEHHWFLDNEGADASFDPVVYIAAADAGVVYGDEDIMRGFDCGFRSLFIGNVEGFVEDEGEVLGR